MTGCAPQASMPGRASRFDLAALADRFAPLLPAGFYYKTFMAGQVARLWTALWEPLLRHMAGLGRAPELPDPSRYDKRHAHCDVLVVGGGPAGLSGGAGCRAARRAGDPRRQRHRVRRRAAAPSGADRRGRRHGMGARRGRRTRRRCRRYGCCRETTVLGYYDDNYLIAAERVGERLGPAAPAGLPRQRLWHIRARRVVLATGAIERPPGLSRQRPARDHAGGRGRDLSASLRGDGRGGARCCSSTMTAPIRWPRRWRGPGSRSRRSSIRGPSRARRRGGWPTASRSIPGHAVVANRRAHGVAPGLGAAERGGRRRGAGGRVTLDCDLLAVSGGWNPNVHLFAQAQRPAALRPGLAALVPDESDAAVDCAGAANGSFSLAACLAEGDAAGARAAALCGFGASGEMPGSRAAIDAGATRRSRTAAAPPIPHALSAGERRRAFVDLHNDVTAADIALAAREGYRGPRACEALHDARAWAPTRARPAISSGLALLAAATGQSLADDRRRRPSARPMRRCRTALLAGRERGTARRPGAGHADARLACRGGRGVRGCRAVEAGALLPASRRGHGGGGAARVPRGARPRWRCSTPRPWGRSRCPGRMRRGFSTGSTSTAGTISRSAPAATA